MEPIPEDRKKKGEEEAWEQKLLFGHEDSVILRCRAGVIGPTSAIHYH